MIYAKSNEIFQQLRSNFKNLFKTKKYIAKVKGNFEPIGLITHKLDTMSKKVKVAPKGEHAELEITHSSYDKEKDVTTLSISLITGHRHQIRVQLQKLGYPIIGDKIYGGESAERLCLHASQYEFQLNDRVILVNSKFTL